MAKELEGAERFDIIDGFVLENADKLDRVLYGDVKRAGVPEGGLIDKYGDESKVPEGEVIAHYDKLAGFISKNIGGETRVKVKTGSFWDMKRKQPRGEGTTKKVKNTVKEVVDGKEVEKIVEKEVTTFEYKPEVMYLFRVGGELVEVDDPSKLAVAITTVQTALAEKEQKTQEKRERAKRKSLIRGN